MNKKNVVIKKNIEAVADFLKESIDWLVAQDMGCCHFNLNEDLALYVGWQSGYDMADTDIIKSPNGQHEHGDWVCGWAIVASIRERNDFDCADLEYLNYPVYVDTDDCVDSDESMRPNMTRREYRASARLFLREFVDIVNAMNRGNIYLLG